MLSSHMRYFDTILLTCFRTGYFHWVFVLYGVWEQDWVKSSRYRAGAASRVSGLWVALLGGKDLFTPPGKHALPCWRAGLLAC